MDQPAAIAAGTAATLQGAVTGSNLKGRALTAYVTTNGEALALAPVTSASGDGKCARSGSITVPAAPAAGDYKVMV